jgi:hypothetical protein
MAEKSKPEQEPKRESTLSKMLKLGGLALVGIVALDFLGKGLHHVTDSLKPKG